MNHIRNVMACVYERTTNGQAEVVAGPCSMLEKPSLQLLYMLNGFTPLGDLAGRLPLSEDAVARRVLDLEERGLVKASV